MRGLGWEDRQPYHAAGVLTPPPAGRVYIPRSHCSTNGKYLWLGYAVTHDRYIHILFPPPTLAQPLLFLPMIYRDAPLFRQHLFEQTSDYLLGQSKRQFSPLCYFCVFSCFSYFLTAEHRASFQFDCLADFHLCDLWRLSAMTHRQNTTQPGARICFDQKYAHKNIGYL